MDADEIRLVTGRKKTRQKIGFNKASHVNSVFDAADNRHRRVKKMCSVQVLWVFPFPYLVPLHNKILSAVEFITVEEGHLG